MANKRTLKRIINNTCVDLLAECLAVCTFSAKTDDEQTEALITSIIAINEDFIRRISHPEPGMTCKAYFKDLVNNFYKQTSEITEQIINLA